MKIDRLLSLIIHLLNRDLVSARELAEKYGVSMRTIQRDMEVLQDTGIPIMTIQGPKGGYGIIDTYKIDKQILSPEDFFYIITALDSIGSSLPDRGIKSTLEKIKTLVPGKGSDFIYGRGKKLSLDFSMLGGGPRQQEVFKVVEEAVERDRLLSFTYTNNQLESAERTVEPMTIVFRYRSWYLFGYCRLRAGYRLFRISRIRDPKIQDRGFIRRKESFDEVFTDLTGLEGNAETLDLLLRFNPKMRSVVEDFYPPEAIEYKEDGFIHVRTKLPENGWLYGYILSYGAFVEVLEPERMRYIIKEAALNIGKIYN